MYTHSFEDLAHTFRILVESFLRFDQLIHIDRAEAIGNLEISTNSMLNAFHNLYDLMNTGGKKSIDWYLTPELCIILAIRNARHHNKANRIRSIHNFFVSNAATLDKKDETLYVNFSAHPKEEGALFFNVPLSWGDLDAFLTLPRKESRLRPVPPVSD